MWSCPSRSTRAGVSLFFLHGYNFPTRRGCCGARGAGCGTSCSSAPRSSTSLQYAHSSGPRWRAIRSGSPPRVADGRSSSPFRRSNVREGLSNDDVAPQGREAEAASASSPASRPGAQLLYNAVAMNLRQSVDMTIILLSVEGTA